MPFYKIYAGLGGGFGGATYQETVKLDNDEQAGHYAWEVACEEYDSYAGYHGLRDTSQIMEEDGIDDEEEAWEVFSEERENWLDYWAEETSNLEDKDE